MSVNRRKMLSQVNKKILRPEYSACPFQKKPGRSRFQHLTRNSQVVPYATSMTTKKKPKFQYRIITKYISECPTYHGFFFPPFGISSNLIVGSIRQNSQGAQVMTSCQIFFCFLVFEISSKGEEINIAKVLLNIIKDGRRH